MGATPQPPSSPTPAWRWRPHRGTVLTSGVEAAPRSSRERILEAACDLIAAEGIDDVRIARVATRAGASTALVHHYFSTREELLEEALIHSFERAGEERFGEQGEVEETATQALARAIGDCLPLAGPQEREWVLWVELWLRAVREPGLRPVAARLYERYRRWMAALILAGTESGEFRSDVDVDAVADVAMALLDGTGVRALIDDPAMDVEAARTLVAERLATELGIEAAALAE
jgi:AcrR family transcriptional regulator